MNSRLTLDSQRVVKKLLGMPSLEADWNAEDFKWVTVTAPYNCLYLGLPANIIRLSDEG